MPKNASRLTFRAEFQCPVCPWAILREYARRPRKGATVRCECGRAAVFVGERPKVWATITGSLRPEIPTHYNRSLGCTVRSRAHLEHLQKKLGVTDYSPSSYKGPPTSWK